QVPKACIKDPDCAHPTFPYLWKHLLGEQITQIDRRLGSFKTFLLDINVRLDERLTREMVSLDDIHIVYQNLDGTALDGSNIEIKKNYELYAHGQKRSIKYPHVCRFYTTGSIKNHLLHRREGLKMTFSGAKIKTRTVELEIKETYTSFLDIYLSYKDE
ncbi:MAG: hypothetical protein KC713_10335, partial [Candidatus Omnitrophica bacterium]|nr:hypothetical protein [Candidatus Omnitrophota bacterium]